MTFNTTFNLYTRHRLPGPVEFGSSPVIVCRTILREELAVLSVLLFKVMLKHKQ